MNCHSDKCKERSCLVDEITLKSVFDLDNLMQHVRCIKRVLILELFFGPPGLSRSPTWKQRMALMRQLGQMKELKELEIKGTLLGQVIPGETLGLAISERLMKLHVHAGVIFDDMNSSKMLGKSIKDHVHLREIRILNFANHAMDSAGGGSSAVEVESLLDPLFKAAATVQTLRCLEVTCLATYTSWRRSYVHSEVMRSLFDLPNLVKINLTKLSLEDEHFKAIFRGMQGNDTVQELILNENKNSHLGLDSVLQLVRTNNRSLICLEAINDVKLSDSSFSWLQQVLEEENTTIQNFACTYKVSRTFHRRAIEFYLKLNQNQRREIIFDPITSPNQCIKVLASVSSDVGCLMYLLRERPSLCDLANNSLTCNPTSNCSLNSMMTVKLFALSVVVAVTIGVVDSV